MLVTRLARSTLAYTVAAAGAQAMNTGAATQHIIATSMLLILAIHTVLSERVSRSPRWGMLTVLWAISLAAGGAVWEIVQGERSNSWIAATLSGGAVCSLIWILGMRALPLYHSRDQAQDLTHFERAIPFLVLMTCFLRLVFSGVIELIPEEGYYWKYAQNLDIGYLDHPPAVALLIRGGLMIFGQNEFAVRVGSTLCWLGMAALLCALIESWFGKKARIPTLLLLVASPFTVGSGFVMTPDAPLTLFWALTLYFLNRALIEGKTRSWYFVGISLGLGLLSKYPMVLLGAAIPVFMLLDRDSRRWFLRPEPYLAAILALITFSPVILWNIETDWISFAFQSTRRFAAEREFSVHLLLLFCILTITPFGLLSLSSMLGFPRIYSKQIGVPPKRQFLFSSVFAAVPLAAFAYASLSQEIKLNWLGPVYISIVPILVYPLIRDADQYLELRYTFLKGWVNTSLVVLSLLSVSGWYLTSGLPGGYELKAAKKFLGWRSLAEQVLAHEISIERETGIRPLVVGGDSHYVASQLDFYRTKIASRGGIALPEPTEGRSLFGKPALMYQFWSMPDEHIGMTALVVSRTKNDLNDSEIKGYFESLHETVELPVDRHGTRISRFYLRRGDRYLGMKHSPESLVRTER